MGVTNPIGAMYFNPRPPRGERRIQKDRKTEDRQISIHALREESDLLC